MDISDFSPEQLKAAEEQRKFYEASAAAPQVQLQLHEAGYRHPPPATLQGKYELVGRLWGYKLDAPAPPRAVAADLTPTAQPEESL